MFNGTAAIWLAAVGVATLMRKTPPPYTHGS
jgi:hypothetical protein